MLTVRLPYECVCMHIKSATPWHHGFWPWCTRMCPNYPGDVIEVRMDPAWKMQVRRADGWHWINEERVKG